MLDLEDLVHTFQAESAFAVEEIGDVGLFESGLLCQTQSRQVALVDALPQSLAEIFLQHFEFHEREYTTVL